MLTNVSQHVPIYLQQFPSYSNRKCKKYPFSRTAAHIFVFLWRRPSDYHPIFLMDEKRVGCLPNPSQHVPIYLEYYLIWYLIECVSVKIAIFTTFLFPWRLPCGNHVKCHIDEKWIGNGWTPNACAYAYTCGARRVSDSCVLVRKLSCNKCTREVSSRTL